MRRDLDLVRDILLIMEQWPLNPTETRIVVTNVHQDLVTGHIGMMHDAGWITAIDAGTRDGQSWMPTGIAPAGYVFLDTVRDATSWNKAKAKLGRSVDALSLAGAGAAIAKIIGQLS